MRRMSRSRVVDESSDVEVETTNSADRHSRISKYKNVSTSEEAAIGPQSTPTSEKAIEAEIIDVSAHLQPSSGSVSESDDFVPADDDGDDIDIEQQDTSNNEIYATSIARRAKAAGQADEKADATADDELGAPKRIFSNSVKFFPLFLAFGREISHRKPITDLDPPPRKRRLSKRNPERIEAEEEPLDLDIDAVGDFSRSISLRPDHASRPLWICPNYMIYLECFHPSYKDAYDFLIAISNPISRTHFVHCYKLNQGSLYAAVSIGLETDRILSALDRLSKVGVPPAVANFIRESTTRFGKVKIVLRKNGYFLESHDREVLEKIFADETIRGAAKSAEIAFEQTEAIQRLSFPSELDAEQLAAEGGFLAESNAQEPTSALPDSALDHDLGPRDTFSFEVEGTKFEDVKRRCIELDYPLLEEYDFTKDSHNPSISISLKPTTTLRKYQEKALSKMFNNGRVRSGIISLPCGAGKTLVGIVAGTTIKKRTLVLCTGGVSVQQWAYQFKLWSRIHPQLLRVFV